MFLERDRNPWEERDHNPWEEPQSFGGNILLRGKDQSTVVRRDHAP
jgi:hypothetical protein